MQKDCNCGKLLINILFGGFSGDFQTEFVNLLIVIIIIIYEYISLTHFRFRRELLSSLIQTFSSAHCYPNARTFPVLNFISDFKTELIL